MRFKIKKLSNRKKSQSKKVPFFGSKSRDTSFFNSHLIQPKDGKKNLSSNALSKQSKTTPIISTTNKNVIQRLMGFEFQTGNEVSYLKRDGNKWERRKIPRTLSKRKPLKKAGKNLEMQTDTGSVIEFVTGPYDKWQDLKADVKAAQDIVSDIKKMPKRKRFPKKPLSKNNPELYIGFPSKNYRAIDVTVEPTSFRAKPQSTEGIKLNEYESLLKEHDMRSKVGPKAVIPKANQVAASMGSSVSGNLKGFIQIIVHTILQAQRNNPKLVIGSSGKTTEPKAFFRLMTRIDFISMYKSLSKAEKKAFRKLVKTQPNEISVATKLNMKDDLFKVGYWGIHPKRGYKFKVLIKKGKIEMIRKKINGVKGKGKKKNIHQCGDSGVPKKYCKGSIPRVTLETWLSSIIDSSRKKDLLSPLPTYAGTKLGGYSMGVWNVRTPGVFPFEMRGYRSKDAVDWLSFAEKKFKHAAKNRPGSNLTYP